MSTQVVIWEAPVIQKPEFRLYYDDLGYVKFYTGGKPEGKYIVIDALTFAEARQDLRVIDGEIKRRVYDVAAVSKLFPSDAGVMCEYDDVSVIIADAADEDGQYWKLKTYEL
jgi:hypothetical protein